MDDLLGKFAWLKKFSAVQQIAISFVFVILTGALLLSLPISNRIQGTGFIDHLFTSTSAVCVTGLATVIPMVQYTIFGQFIIILLMQIGGLGLMTLIAVFLIFVGGKLSHTEKLAMAEAVSFLVARKVSRIILARPAVEAGEKLGFLPGDLQEKVNPYLRPLYDALYDMLDVDRVSRYLERGVIEVAPIAFMRGRTLNDSFVILDEAQNTSPEQMKMFLTRLGFGSKIVITGDVTQIDLPKGASGLRQVREILHGVTDIEFCDLTAKDVVRHKLVQRIVTAYSTHEEALARAEEAKAKPSHG